MSHHLISFMIFFPLVGAILQMFVSNVKGRWVALSASIASSICAFLLALSMNVEISDPQAIEVLPWVGSYAISYEMALDGLNVLLILLIALVFPVLISSEWTVKPGIRGLHSLFLILQMALFGSVCAQDLFLQFFFWGLTALPFYFLVGIWGGENRERASFSGIVTASLGNALFFTALVLIYYSVDPHSFSLRELSGGKLAGKTFELLGYELSVSTTAFFLMGVGLSFRVPIWPLHGWFSEVAQEAPSSVFVALSATVVPVAMYILVKDCYLLFPETMKSMSQVVAGIGALNLVMGGVCAVAQKGLRRMLAFLCLSEVGLVLLGIGSLNPTGLVGAVFQQLIFGLGLAGFGLFTGILAERTGTAEFLNADGMPTFGGIATRAPNIAIVAGIILASLLGFPGFAGFVGHALVIIGSYSIHPASVALVALALLLAAYYLFFMYRAVFLGKSSALLEGFQDLTLREKAYMFPIVVSLLWFGLYPKPLIELIRPTVVTLLSRVK